jgi:hypothetical protein
LGGCRKRFVLLDETLAKMCQRKREELMLFELMMEEQP